MQQPPEPPTPPPQSDTPRALVRTSHSAANEFGECPERFRRKRLLMQTERPGWALIGGKAVHTCTERWCDPDYRAAQPGWDWEQEFLRAFHEHIQVEIAATGVEPHEWRVSGRASREWPDKETREFWESEGPKFAENYGVWRGANPGFQLWIAPDGTAGREMEILEDFDGIPFLCYIDRVYTLGDDLVVVDLKSGRTTPDTTIQLLRYATCIERKYGIRPRYGAFFDCRKGKLLHLEDMSVLTSDEVIEDIHTFMTQAREFEFPAKPGRQCTYCPFNRDCKYAKTLTFGLRPKELTT